MTSRSHRSSRPIPTPSGGAVAGVAAGGMVGVAGAGGSGAGMDGMGSLAGMGSSQGWSSSGGSVVGGGVGPHHGTPAGGNTAGAGGTNDRRAEREIERSREIENWDRVLELAASLRLKRDRKYHVLADFLMGEAKLEGFLKKTAKFHTEKLSAESCPELMEAKASLQKTIGEGGMEVGVELDSYILLGKLHFALGDNAEALKFYGPERGKIESLEEKQLPPRSLKMIAEAFAIKAMALEKESETSGSSNSVAQAERQATIIRCFEVASDLTLLYLQTADGTRRTSGGQSTWSVASAGTSGSISPTGGQPPLPGDANFDGRPKIGQLLDQCLYKAAALNIQQGKPLKAVTRLRNMLMAEETASTKEIRRNVSCQLAEVLISNYSASSKYQKPNQDISTSTTGTGSFKRSSTKDSSSAGGVSGSWKPMKHLGNNLFSPCNKYEELILILLLSENIANKGAVLSQGPELAPARKATYEAATVTYDLLTLSLARMENYRLLSDMLERSMKFSYQERHTWEQFALVLNVQRKYYRSLLVARDIWNRDQKAEEAAEGKPQRPTKMDAGACLATSRLCYEKLSLFEEGMAWANRALQTPTARNTAFLEARCCVYVGIGCLLSTTAKDNLEEKGSIMTLAGEKFKRAAQLDHHDHFVQFYLAYFYAQSRQIQKASYHIREALRLNPYHLPSFHLMILLLTSGKEHDEALKLADHAVEEFPDNIELRCLKVKLEELVNGPDEAIKCAKELMIYWQTLAEEHHLTSNDDSERANDNYVGQTKAASVSSYGLSQSVASGIGGGGTMTGSNMGAAYDAYSETGDSLSFHAQSVAPSLIERAFSEIGSSLSTAGQFVNNNSRSGGVSKDPTYCLMRVWLAMAELHLDRGDLQAADECAMEARTLTPHAYQVTVTRALIQEACGHTEAARHLFEDALAVNPFNSDNIAHLARIYFRQGHHRLALTAMSNALRIDPYNEQYWAFYGQVYDIICCNSRVGVRPGGPATNSNRDSRTEDSSDDEEETAYYEAKEMGSPFINDGSIWDNVLTLDETDTLFGSIEELLTKNNHEVTKKSGKAAQCHSIALALLNTGPIVPFSTVHVAYD